MSILSEPVGAFKSNFTVFVKDWHKLNKPDFNNKLQRFIDTWQDCACTGASSSVLPMNLLNAEKIQTFITEILPHLDSLRSKRKTGDFANIWNVSKIGSNELRVSSVLAWFLDCYEEHGQKSAILCGLLDKICSKNIFTDQFPTSEIISKDQYWVNVEPCPSGDRSSRVDIEIEGIHFLLFIEVKIFADETGDQLDRYLSIGRSKSAGRPWGIIFLTLDGHPAKKAVSANSNNAFACVSWKDIADIFYNHAQCLSSCFSKSIISQFADHISDFRRS